MKRFALSCIVLSLVGFSAQPTLAQYTIWHSPLTLSTDQSQLTINHKTQVTRGVRVQTSSAGDNQWVYLGLTIPSNVVIDSVIVCYRLSSAASFISQIRLTTMKTPDVSLVLFDDPTDLTEVGPACYSTHLGGAVVNGAITLALRLNFANTADWIDIGAIGIVVSPTVTSVPEQNETGSPSNFSLGQNYPNPFNPSTTIDYDVQQKGSVRIDIYNSLGQPVRTLVDGIKPEGSYHATWDGRDNKGLLLPSGVYYYQMRVGDHTSARRMLLLK
ncbi:MAG: FlgD immunoglobulin-like domain containing protein [bacterium]